MNQTEKFVKMIRSENFSMKVLKKLNYIRMNAEGLSFADIQLIKDDIVKLYEYDIQMYSTK